MCADPSPKESVFTFEMADRAVMIADPDRPLTGFDGFETKRWMSRVTLPDQIIFISELLDPDRQIIE